MDTRCVDPLPAGFAVHLCRHPVHSVAQEQSPFSKINQLVQAVGFSLPGFTLVYFAGLHLGLGIQFTGDSNLLSQFGFFKMQFDFSGAGEGTFVLINVVAILFLVWLTRLENVAAEEQPEVNAGAELAERVLDYSGRY